MKGKVHKQHVCSVFNAPMSNLSARLHSLPRLFCIFQQDSFRTFQNHSRTLKTMVEEAKKLAAVTAIDEQVKVSCV